MIRTLPVLGLLAATPALAADNWRPDDKIPNALSAQITKKGFDTIEGAVVEILPALLEEQLGGALELDDITAGSGIFSIQLRNLQPVIGVRGIDIAPVTPTSISWGAEINLRINATLGLNSATEPYYLGVTTIFDLCDGNGWLAPTNVTVNAPLRLAVVTKPDGTKGFEVDISIPSNNGITLGALQLRGECDGLLNTIGTALSDVLVDAILIPQIRPVLDDLEPQIEDALAAAVISQEIDALGKTLFVDLEPQQIKSSPDGLELVYQSKFTAAQDPCTMAYDPLGSLKTGTPVPPLSGNPVGTQVAAYISDDMVNQALYAAFSGGILCIDVDADLLGDSLPIALDSSLVTLLGGPEYEAIVPAEAKPLLIQTRPRKVPTASWTGDEPITLQLDEFGLDFYTEIEGRNARVFGFDLQADIGLDVALDSATGQLDILLGGEQGLSADQLTFSLNGDLFVPGTEVALLDSVTGLVDTVLGIALGSLTDSLSFTLPAFSGLGLTKMEFGPGGTQQDWLRGAIELGPVSYGSAGCDSTGDGGCGGCGGDSSCGGGCSAAGVNLGTGLAFLVPFWALRRRRR